MIIGEYSLLYKRKPALRIEASPTGFVTAVLPPFEAGAAQKLSYWAISTENDRPLEIVVTDENNFFLDPKFFLLGKKYIQLEYIIPKDKITPKMKVVIGWDPQHPGINTSAPFWLVAAPPKMLGVPKKKWAEKGLCPSCGTEGGWKPPATLWCSNCSRAYAGI